MRSADLVVLLLGALYGYPQGSSALSPTHEEYIEAGTPSPYWCSSGRGGARARTSKVPVGGPGMADGTFPRGIQDARAIEGPCHTSHPRLSTLAFCGAPRRSGARRDGDGSSPSHAAEQPLRSPDAEYGVRRWSVPTGPEADAA
ncbi:MAG: hypothetical protein IPQ15_15580 [Betaproteobacteria bacterium]|nr:hypothetical protein [Betaproteobacteria bacterium]